MTNKEPKFKTFSTNPNYSSTRDLQDQVDSFFRDYVNVEILSTAQSQVGGFINLSVFFRGDKKNPKE